MNIKHRFSIFLLFTILLASCTTLELGIETTPTADRAAIETAVAEMIRATAQAAQTGTAQPVATTAATAEAAATLATSEAPRPTPSSPYAGLIYRLGDQLLRLGPNGEAVLLAPGIDPQYLPGQFTPRGAISPDGQWMVSWWDYEDLWLINLETGKLINLTQTAERIEYGAQFVAGQPDTIIFISQEKMSMEMSAGYITAMKLDGSGYSVLDESAGTIGQPAVSPDGQTIAYDRIGKPWLFRWKGGAQAFDPSAYGLQLNPDNLTMGSAAWSPSGKHLAWIIGGDLIGDGDSRTGVAIFDLQSSTYRLLHPYRAMGRDGWFAPPSWSPDGNWIAFTDESVEQPGLRLAHPDGSGEVVVYTAGVRSIGGLSAFWQPGGQYLLVSDPNAEGGIHLTLLNLLSMQMESSPLPAGAIPLAWIP